MLGTLSDNIYGDVHDTELAMPGKINIENIGIFDYHPREVKPIRNDLFQPDHISVFDILLTLFKRGEIELIYHFEESMDTYIIDSINEKKHWWYRACCHRGQGTRMNLFPCRETNIMPMDQFPCKDMIDITFYQIPREDLNIRYNAFTIETERKRTNFNKIIIPKVTIYGVEEIIKFNNVEVQPHNLRIDIFKKGVVTAVDAILTLGDEKKISYDLTWREKIGRTEIKAYYVTRLNHDEYYDRCGFTYECGTYLEYEGFKGNFIHLTSDMRIINSPSYMDWMWICLYRGSTRLIPKRFKTSKHLS